MMNIILLSGGSGKRLWPLSNDIRSKQFIKIFKNNDDQYESMVQRVYRQIMSVDPSAKIIVATGKSQVSTIYNQLGDNVGLCVEPCRRDTFPAIVLATSFLVDICGLQPDEVVVACPVDPYVDEDFFRVLAELSHMAKTGDKNLYLMGMEPTYASEKYGYILPKTRDRISDVAEFKEKPDTKTAEGYINKGALWNGGVFAYKASYMLEKADGLIGYHDYDSLLDNYEKLPKISIDYEVVEKEPKISVLRFCGTWKDLGTWNTLTEGMPEPVIGDGRMDEKCENVHIVNDLDMPILAMGLKNVVIGASPEGILVSEKSDSSFIKPFVDEMDERVMFAEKSWGGFRVIDAQDDSMTIKVSLSAGQHMSYHSHEHRDEVWVVISGRGRTIVDGMEQPVKKGDVITMQSGCRHTVIADTDLRIIEVQLGEEISVEDKRKYELEVFDQ